MRCLTIYALFVWMTVGMAAPAHAQFGAAEEGGRFGVLSAFDDQQESDPVTLSAQFTAAAGERPAVLMITARIEDGYHVYALTQPPGGPQKTRIDLAPSPQYTLLGPFAAYPEPKSHIDQVAWAGLELQEHDGEVTWYAPIELAPGVDPNKLDIRGTVHMQACKDICIPVNAPFDARLGKGVPIGPLKLASPADLSEAGPKSQPPAAALTGPTFKGTYHAQGSEVTIRGQIEPASVRPGQSARLMLTAEPAENWHVYANAQRDDKPGSKPTLIAIQSASGLTVGRPTTNARVIEEDQSSIGFGLSRYHEGTVRWTVPIDVPANAEPGDYKIAGVIGYQACESRNDGMGSCELPKGARFLATLQVGSQSGPASMPITFAAAQYRDASVAAAAWASDGSSAASGAAEAASPAALADGSAPYDLERVVVQEQSGSLAHYIVFAFLGGIILNLMPCVLPVIGLKVMSFVEQAGHSRSHALALNVWYSAGIVSVFLLLGLLAAWIGLSWGGQFGSTAFNVALAAVVFAMALSLLGVWEIPIPGFFGSGQIQDVAAKEGPLGAFLKGVVTTVLATPCTGPFMASAVAWAVTQPSSTIIAVFASLGLGMASPYLVVGVFPELLRFLPKPGAWMETFKQLMGFVLLATVVFILTFINSAAVVPTVALLVGIGLACWLVARTPLTAALADRLQTWGLASSIVLLFAVVSFTWLYGTGPPIRWEAFSLERLQQVAVQDGRTVLVDFSADWCLTCKTLEKTVLHTEAVEDAIADSDLVTMYADFTDYPPEIERTLQALKSNGVPVIAIFPGSRPYEPIVFRGGYSKQSLLEAIDDAASGSGDRGSLVADEQAGAATGAF